MISNKRKRDEPIIIWEKWVDPLGLDEENTISYENDEYDDEDFSDYNNQKNRKIIKEIKCKYMVTPLGMIPYNEHTASGKIFNFWTGHTNFGITQEVFDIIENTDGVETFDVFTKYRFRIGIGKAFKDSEIMRNINLKTYKHLKESI